MEDFPFLKPGWLPRAARISSAFMERVSTPRHIAFPLERPKKSSWTEVFHPTIHRTSLVVCRRDPRSSWKRSRHRQASQHGSSNRQLWDTVLKVYVPFCSTIVSSYVQIVLTPYITLSRLRPYLYTRVCVLIKARAHTVLFRFYSHAPLKHMSKLMMVYSTYKKQCILF